METERLIIRKVKEDDLDDIFYNWASDRITNEYLTFKCHETRDQTKKMMDFWLNKKESKGCDFVIELKDSNEVIGIISADCSYKYKCLEIGYSIGSKYFNKGYTSEACKEFIKDLFENYDCDIVEAVIPSKNIGSIKVAEKCGMKKEAVLKNRFKNKLTNEINDLYIYSIFKN